MTLRLRMQRLRKRKRILERRNLLKENSAKKNLQVKKRVPVKMKRVLQKQRILVQAVPAPVVVVYHQDKKMLAPSEPVRLLTTLASPPIPVELLVNRIQVLHPGDSATTSLVY
uniref:Uncharacterized protein n=1 Tax=Cacopsylla melanoneura TaxID=428564 RepID=A0A8D8LZH6_9HEMI